MDAWSEADDVVEEVREIRRRISAARSDDPAKVVAHYMEYQKRFADRLVSHAPRRGRGEIQPSPRTAPAGTDERAGRRL